MTISHATELRDSRPLLGDWQALRARIAEEGYVFMRGLIDPAFVAAVGRTCLSYLQAAGWTQPGHDPVEAPPRLPVRAVLMRDAFGDPGYRRVYADPGFNAVPSATAIADLLGQIMGPAAFCYPLRLPRIVYPAAVVPRQPGNFIHKDYRAVQDMFTCWVPLGHIPPALGGLAIQPGSQRWARVTERGVLRRLEPGWATTEYEPGDVLVFHCLTTHAALPNHENRMRFSGEYRWQLADQPAPRRMVMGPGRFERHAHQFQGLPWWRPVPAGLRLFDDQSDDTPAGHAVLPAPPSRFVAFSNNERDRRDGVRA